MAARPRLLILTPDFPPAPGGIQLMAHRHAAGIAGFETRVLTLAGPGAEEFDRDSGCAVRRVGANALPRNVRGGLLNAIAFADALRFRPDVTLCEHIVASPAAAAIRAVLGTPTVQIFHAEEIGARPKLAAFAIAHADEVIAVSRYTAGLIAATGATPASVRLISPGVDIPSNPSPLAVDRPTLLTVARLEERYKGHDVLVRALALVHAQVPDVHWVVIGDGSLRAGIEALARTYGVHAAISFLGTVSDEQRNDWLRRAHVLAMPSRLPAGGFAGEGFGIAFLEAGAYSKPVVAGNVGGALDSVSDGESGLLVDPNDPVAVADAITRLLLDSELATRLGAAGQRRAHSYAWPVIVERLEAVLLEQLAPPAARRGASSLA
ncbi:MAG TPA: glycosyltransferase family 4 protein [Solirubrobacteraceae bacterium]|jgi:phosphatidylinositol alpha-1,6-mannosyltransferase